MPNFKAASNGDNLEAPFRVSRVRQAGENAGFGQVWEVVEDFLLGHAGGEVMQHVIHRDAAQ